MASRMLRQWWTQSNHESLIQSQEKLLKTLVKSPVAGTHQGNLNSVEFVSPFYKNDKSLPTVCLAHGFGSGLGFFFRNIDPLLQSGKVGRLLLVDWMGMGGSERPPCRRPIRGWTEFSTTLCDSRFTPSQAVDFFIEPLEQWFVEQNVNENLILIGHSLGGYLAARYALAYPKRLSKLVLASPVGFPSKPTDVLSGSSMPPGLRIIDALWSSNVTPQQLVRAMGASRGRQNVYRALKGRIPHLQGDDVDLLADYLFHITVASPSGEFAMNSLLEPAVSPNTVGVFAREPLQESFANLNTTSSMELRVLFGDNDWMRFNEASAREVVNQLNQKKMANASVHIIPNAGHHLYLDNAPDFVNHVLAP